MAAVGSDSRLLWNYWRFFTADLQKHSADSCDSVTIPPAWHRKQQIFGRSVKVHFEERKGGVFRDVWVAHHLKTKNSNVVHTGLNIWPSLWKYQHQQCHHHTMLLITIIITIIVKDIFLLRLTLFPCSLADTQRTTYRSIMQIRCWSVSIVLVMCRRDGVRPLNTCADEKPDQSTSRRLSVCATLDRVRSSVTVLHTTSDDMNFSFHVWIDNWLFLSSWLFTFYRASWRLVPGLEHCIQSQSPVLCHLLLFFGWLSSWMFTGGLCSEDDEKLVKKTWQM